MGPIRFPETSARNYHHSLRSNPEGRGNHLLRGGIVNHVVKVVSVVCWLFKIVLLPVTLRVKYSFFYRWWFGMCSQNVHYVHVTVHVRCWQFACTVLSFRGLAFNCQRPFFMSKTANVNTATQNCLGQWTGSEVQKIFCTSSKNMLSCK